MKNPIFIALMAFSISSFAQDKFTISTGIGLPEAFNVGARYRIEQAEVSLGVGFSPNKNGPLTTFGADLFYHFAGVSKYTDLRTLFLRLGLDYEIESESGPYGEKEYYKYFHFNSRIGYNINFSPKMGIDIDAGAIFLLSFESPESSSGSYYWDALVYDIFPSLGLRLFYRL